MSPIAKQISDIIDMLPEQEQSLAYEVLKRIMLAWDPDFTKVTPAEAKALAEARERIEKGDCLSFSSPEEMEAFFE